LAWNVEFTATAEKQLKKLDRKWQALILDYLEDEVAPLENPRNKGKSLLRDKKDLWRYRIGDYRAICKIEDERMVIVAVTVGHRKDVYDK
jgi:mRNA interferase RelE/StbE